MNDGSGRINTVYAFAKGSFDEGRVEEPDYIPPKRKRWHPDSFLLPALIGFIVAVVSFLAVLGSLDARHSWPFITWTTIMLLSACVMIFSLSMASRPTKDDA